LEVKEVVKLSAGKQEVYGTTNNGQIRSW